MSAAGASAGGLAKLLCALWLAGLAMRMTILVMPPVIPLVHADLHMSETQVGLLIGLPLAMFAIAAVPGSLLIARIGTRLAVVAGMTIAALAGGARAGAGSVATLYLASIVTGFGVAIMQPALPTLVREWLPRRLALGTIAYTAGMLMGGTFPPVLTTPLVLPLVGGAWRLNLVAWAVPALLFVPLFLLLSPRQHNPQAAAKALGRGWWPDFRNPIVWLLGLTLGSNNSPYFTTNAFLGDFLAVHGQSKLLGAALTALNGSQLVAVLLLLLTARRLERRAWPFLLFGPLLLVGLLVLMFVSAPAAIMISAVTIGFTTAVTFTAALTLPPVLSTPADLPRTAAGMFTISYTGAILIPTISGALWDATGTPWTAFLPLCVCAMALTVLGFIVTRYPAAAAAAGP